MLPETIPNMPKKPRGRPKGSKNQPGAKAGRPRKDVETAGFSGEKSSPVLKTIR
jgi:hypothetical protein